jgi:hypothetical protein
MNWYGLVHQKAIILMVKQPFWYGVVSNDFAQSLQLEPVVSVLLALAA